MSSNSNSSEESYVVNTVEEINKTEFTTSIAESLTNSQDSKKTSSGSAKEKSDFAKLQKGIKQTEGIKSSGGFSVQPIRNITPEDTSFFNSKENLLKIARLANLILTEDEEIKFPQQLFEALEYIAQLNEVPTKNVESIYSVTGLSNVMRPDETELSLTQDQALQNTHSKENGFFRVKAIFEKQWI